MLPRAADAEQTQWSSPAPARSQSLRLVEQAKARDESGDEWAELYRRAQAATESAEEREWAAQLARVQKALVASEEDEWAAQLARVRAEPAQGEEDEWAEFIRRARSTEAVGAQTGLAARSYIAALRPEPKAQPSGHPCETPSQPLRFSLPGESPSSTSTTPIPDEASRVVAKAKVLPVSATPVTKATSYLASKGEKLEPAREKQDKLESGIKPITAKYVGRTPSAERPAPIVSTPAAQPRSSTLPPPAAATRAAVPQSRTSATPAKPGAAARFAAVAADKQRTSSPGMAALRMKATQRATSEVTASELPALAVRKVEESVIAQREAERAVAARPAAPVAEEVAPAKKDSSLMLLSRTLEAVKPEPRRPSRGAPPPPPPRALMRGPAATPQRPVPAGPTKVLPSGLPALQLPLPPPKTRMPVPMRPKLNIPPPPPPSRAAGGKGVAERLGAAFAWLSHRGGPHG